MSPDEIAELRRLLGEKGAWANEVDLIQASVAALPKLLDALEAAQLSLRRLLEGYRVRFGINERFLIEEWRERGLALEAAQAEIARLRAVAEAARAVRDHHTTDAASMQCDALRAALTAYDAGGTE